MSSSVAGLSQSILSHLPQSLLRAGANFGEGIAAAAWRHAVRDDVSYELPNHHRLSLSIAGEAHVWRRLGGRDLRGRGAESQCLIPAGMTTDWRVSGSADELHLYIPRPLFDRAVVAIFDRDPSRIELLERPFFQDDFLGRLLGPDFLGSDWREPANRLTLSQSCFAVLSHLARNYSTAGSRAPIARGGLAPAVRRRVEDYVTAHVDAPLGLTDLAEVAGLSAFHFARMFKQSTGESPHAFVLRQRIERAKFLLADRRMPLSKIAGACGFSSQSHFSARFREMTSVTPRVYRAVLSNML